MSNKKSRRAMRWKLDTWRIRAWPLAHLEKSQSTLTILIRGNKLTLSSDIDPFARSRFSQLSSKRSLMVYPKSN